MDTIAGVLVLGGFVVLFTSTIGGGKRDRRYKTGHRDNILPEDVPFNLRLTIACVLWAIAVCLVWPMHVLQVGVAGAATAGVWLAYPSFHSRYKQETTSSAKFLAGRVISCVMLGILLPLYIFQLALPPTQALLPKLSGENVSNRASSTPTLNTVPMPAPAETQSIVDTTPQKMPVEAPDPVIGATTPSAEPIATTGAPESTKLAPAPAQGSLTANPVTNLILAALAADWQNVDRLVASTRPSNPLAERGDRKAARAANAQGLALLNQHQYEAAIAAFSAGIKADPSDVEIINNLGFAYISVDRSNEAIDTLAVALLAVPDRSSAWANLSEAFSQLQNENASIGALRLAARFSGNREKTTEYLRKVSSDHPQPIYRSAAARVLGELGSIPTSAKPADPAPSAPQTNRY